jgi:hypothetical protein
VAGPLAELATPVALAELAAGAGTEDDAATALWLGP